jgi:hypothetical protein
MNPLPRTTLIPLTKSQGNKKDIISREIIAEKDKDSVQWEKCFSKLEVS